MRQNERFDERNEERFDGGPNVYDGENGSENIDDATEEDEHGVMRIVIGR